MIEPNEVERLGGELARLLARYSNGDLRKILNFAYANRVKGGAMPRLARLLEEFAAKIKSPITPQSPRSIETSEVLPNGNR
jgi:hypothetical protein